MESKKLVPIRILNILEKYSDENHPLTHEDIAKKLEQNYGIELERKAIGRYIKDLIEMTENDAENKEHGEETTIKSDRRKGTYIEKRMFEDSELRMLIDGVLSSKYINEKYSKDLIFKLSSLSNEYFKPHENIYSVSYLGKTENFDLFYNIDLIEEAIKKNKMIQFNYNRYEIDKKLHKDKQHKVSPYQTLIHNQRYYLMARDEDKNNVAFYHLSRIKDMKIIEDSIRTDLKSNKEFEDGINYHELATCRPYLFMDKPEEVVFTTHVRNINYVIDWFGNDFDVEFSEKTRTIKVTLKVSPKAMEYWAMQYMNIIEIISPSNLRNTIKKNIKNAMIKYAKDDLK